jgi:hypothetical protein
MNLFSLTNKPESVSHYEHREYIQKNIALSSPREAYYYALQVLKGRFQDGEKAISTDAEYSYRYAKDVLKDRFEAGESAILSSAYKEKYHSCFLNRCA